MPEEATNGSPSHQQSKPPSDAALRTLIGTAWSRYQTALKGLAAMGLTPEFYRYTPSGGWAVRFQINHVTGCALYVAKSLIGLVAIGSRAEAALENNPQCNEQLMRLVAASPRKGKMRWVQMPLRSQENVRLFLTLVEAKLQGHHPPKDTQAAKKPVSHTPRRRTTPAAAGRKKTGTPPRRSAARRNSRG